MRRPISKRLFLGGLVCIAVARPAPCNLATDLDGSA